MTGGRRSDPSSVFCRGVSKTYRSAGGDVMALHSVDADFPPAALTVVRGISGSGKSTLLRLLAATDRPDSGSIIVAGVDVARLRARGRRKARRRLIGYVHQQPEHNLLPYLGSGEQLDLAADLRGCPRRPPAELLAVVGLEDRIHHRPAQLSGGEQQRLAFAVAAVGPPRVLVADEPTAELDAASAAALVAAVRDLAASGVTVVASSHDESVVGAADHLVRISGGTVQRP